MHVKITETISTHNQSQIWETQQRQRWRWLVLSKRQLIYQRNLLKYNQKQVWNFFWFFFWATIYRYKPSRSVRFCKVLLPSWEKMSRNLGISFFVYLYCDPNNNLSFGIFYGMWTADSMSKFKGYVVMSGQFQLYHIPGVPKRSTPLLYGILEKSLD